MNLIISFCHIGSQWGQKFYGIFKINELKSQSGFLRTQSVAKKAWLAILSHIHMGKSLSEALIFELTNPQYDDILFIELQVLILAFRTIYVHNMFSPCSKLGIFTNWTCNSMNNMSSYCGLVDAKIRASDKDLPVVWSLFQFWKIQTLLVRWRHCANHSIPYTRYST